MSLGCTIAVPLNLSRVLFFCLSRIRAQAGLLCQDAPLPKSARCEFRLLLPHRLQMRPKNPTGAENRDQTGSGIAVHVTTLSQRTFARTTGIRCRHGDRAWALKISCCDNVARRPGELSGFGVPDGESTWMSTHSAAGIRPGTCVAWSTTQTNCTMRKGVWRL